jgi:hypothetical protein
VADYVILILTFHDSQTREYRIGDGQDFFGWKINPDNMLVLMRRQIVDRVVIPLVGNVREIEVMHVPLLQELRKGAQ